MQSDEDQQQSEPDKQQVQSDEQNELPDSVEEDGSLSDSTSADNDVDVLGQDDDQQTDIERLVSQYNAREQYQFERFEDDELSDDGMDEKDESVVSRIEALGNEAFRTMTNFYPHEFRELYAKVEPVLTNRQRRGRQPTFDPVESFFLTLVMLRHYPKWQKFAADWNVKTPNVIKNTVMRTLLLIHKPLVDALIPVLSKKAQLDHKLNFEHFPEAALVVNVIFQPTYRPKTRFHEGRLYYSKKQHQYGVKTQIAHASDGRAMFVGKHGPGSVHDYSLFVKDVPTYKKFLKKRNNEAGLEDDGVLQNTYGDAWALLAGKSYQGAASVLRAIVPKTGKLTREDEAYNKRIAHERTICANFYGRMKMMWAIMRNTFRWDHEQYDRVVQVCVALTNFHIRHSPLRYNMTLSRDGELYHRIEATKRREGEVREAKHRERNRRWRERMKARAMSQTRPLQCR